MSASGDTPSLSLVIPVLNEAAVLPDLLQRLAAWRDYAEIILVDGGSVDGGTELAVSGVDRLLHSSPGRARQQNAGAAVARGEYLLFLHCDTQLAITPGELLAALSTGPHWGFFQVRLSGADWRLRIVERFMSWRSRLTHVATGDQCMIVSRSLFESLGGFADIPLMEDVEFCKRLRRHASPRVLLPPVVTSSRRWERQGVLRTVLLMWGLRLRYWLGADPVDLAEAYRGR